MKETILFSIVGILVFLYGTKQYIICSRKYVTIYATLRECHGTRVANGLASHKYMYEYDFKGVHYKKIEQKYQTSSFKKEGNQYKILVNPDKPTVIYGYEKKSIFICYLIIGVVSVLMLLNALFIQPTIL